MEDWNGFARQYCYNAETGEYEPRWNNTYRPGKEYASGGAGCMEDFVTLFQALPKVDAGLAASIFHFGEVQIPDLKRTLAEQNIPVRL